MRYFLLIVRIIAGLIAGLGAAFLLIQLMFLPALRGWDGIIFSLLVPVMIVATLITMRVLDRSVQHFSWKSDLWWILVLYAGIWVGMSTLSDATYKPIPFMPDFPILASPVAAYPESGSAPLTVAFSARGGFGGIDYGDGNREGMAMLIEGCGTSACYNLSSQHTYLLPGTYTATVTGYDGKTAIGSVVIHVSAAAIDFNQKPRR